MAENEGVELKIVFYEDGTNASRSIQAISCL